MTLFSRRATRRSAGWLLSLVVSSIWFSSPSVQAEPPADLPSVIGLQVDDAVKTLSGINVRSATVPDPIPEGVERSLVLVQDVVDATPDRTGGPTTSVLLLLGARVPKLSGLSAADATRSLAAAGLLTRRIPPDALDDAVVRGQDPPPGDLVPLGAPVAVTVRGAVIPTPRTRVSVPSVLGLNPTQAGDVLRAADLALSATRAGTGKLFSAVRQNPQPGTVVRSGSTVTVRFEAGPPPDSSHVPVVAVGIAGLIVLVVVIFFRWRRIRANRQRKWVREHISARVAATAAAEITLVDRDPTSGHTMQLKPHADRGTQILQERSP